MLFDPFSLRQRLKILGAMENAQDVHSVLGRLIQDENSIEAAANPKDSSEFLVNFAQSLSLLKR